MHRPEQPFGMRVKDEATAMIPSSRTYGSLQRPAHLINTIERPHPSVEEAQQAISGNRRRCTGETKVIEAIMSAEMTST